MNKRRLSKITPYILILPFLCMMSFVFAGGLLQAVVQSTGYMPVFGMYDVSLRYYVQLFSNARFMSSLWYTFYIAFVSAALSVSLGVLIAFAVDKSRSGESLSYTLYKVPIIIPHIVVAILVIQIFFQTGIISRILFALNIIQDATDFPLLIYDRGGIGIMLAYLYKQAPFVTLTVFTVLKGLNKKYVQVAQNLGANSFQTVFRVTLPLLAPTILSTFLITFAFAFGAFEIPFLLRSPARLTLPILAYFDYRSPVLAHMPAAMATSVTISVISLSFIVVYMWLLRAMTRRGMEGGGFL
ncbi:MAG: ABC transporter permease subunit [Defluviitaleaceae bacterium]|nr:ABC transporter permease subunit [Defluviitaleaceae bacterium]